MPTINGMVPGRECFHCKQWITDGESHDCWTTTEAALTRELPVDLRDAWERLRETAVEFGDQRIYASHNSIMFSRRSCYFFVRPKRSFLEVCIFLGRRLRAPAVRRMTPSSKSKFAHFVRVTHRDEVEMPLTGWLHEAYEFAASPAPKPAAGAVKGCPSAVRAGAAAVAAGSKRKTTKKSGSRRSR